MAGFRIEGSTSGNGVEVDANNRLKVAQPTNLAQAGFSAICAIVDDGVQTGASRINRGYISEGGGLRQAIPTLLWDDTFNATAQNTAKYRVQTATQTVTFVSGFAILNGSSITTINTNSAIQTYRAFPLFAKSELRCNTSAMITVVPQANAVIEFGLFSATLPGGAAPSDGVFFRWNAAGELRGVISYNGTETQTAAMTAPSVGVNHDFVIVCQTNTALFYIDDVLAGKVVLSVDAPTLGQPMSAAAQPFTARYYIGGSAPTLAGQFKISDVFVTILGPDLARPWSHQKAGFGHMAYQGQNGGVMGSTALMSNSLASGAGAAMTNTTAALGTGLGGQFSTQPTLAVGTDGIVCSYQNPAGSATQTPRNLVITGVRIQGAVSTTALTGGPVLYAYSLAFGHTVVSLAAAESANGKATRRIPLGFETYAAAAAVGVIGTGVFVTFTSPIVVAPGEFVAIVAKNLGVVTSAGVITFLVAFDAYNE